MIRKFRKSKTPLPKLGLDLALDSAQPILKKNRLIDFFTRKKTQPGVVEPKTTALSSAEQIEASDTLVKATHEVSKLEATTDKKEVKEDDAVTPAVPTTSAVEDVSASPQSSSVIVSAPTDNKVNENKDVHHPVAHQQFTGSAIMEIDDICKSYVIGTQTVQILKNVSFKIKEGDFVVVFGPSGCGKSTLLHTILGLEPPTSGNIRFMDNNLYENSSEDDRAVVRKHHVGMIYQQPNWIKSLNVIENVMFPLTLLGAERDYAEEKGIGVLKQVQMENWAYYHPNDLSSGQQQRVAMARALINNPMLVVADEPTGNLDYDSGKLVMQLFSDLNEQQKKTVIMVTHDLEYLKYSKTAVRMLDGQVVGIYDQKDQEKLFKELQYKRGFLQSADSTK